MIQFFTEFVPDPLFLFVAAGFEGVVLAIFVPVSLEIISKTSAKYNSDVVVRLYRKSLAHRLFPFLLLTSICGMLTMRFFMTEELGASLGGRIIMWSLMFTTVLIIFLLGYLIYRMDQFISKDTVPLNMLFRDLKRLMKIKKTARARRLLIDTMSGIGDILTYQTGRQNNLALLEELPKIWETIEKLLELKKKDPKQFSNLVYDPEFVEYMRKKPTARELAYFCFTSPDKHLAGFAVPVNQLIRIYKVALETSNAEVARKSLNYLHLILQSCVTEDDNEFLVEWMLKHINECVNLGMRAGEEAERLSLTWYRDILFREPHTGKGAFRLDYLELCESYFAKMLATMVARGYDTHYRKLADSMARDFVFPNYQRGKLWGYHYLLRVSDYEAYKEINLKYRLQYKIRKLLLSEHMVQTEEDLKSWENDFREIKKIIVPNLRDEYKAEATGLEKAILSYVTAYMKYKRLMRLFYALGTYCDLRERYDLMFYLWEAGQTGEGTYRILPPSPQVLINDYLTYPAALNKNYFGESYQVMSVHRKRYYVLLLARLLADQAAPDYRLPPLSLNQLRDFPALADELTEITGQLKEEASQRLRLLWRLAFGGYRDPEEWVKKVTDYLLLVKKSAQKQLTIKQRTTEISVKRKDEFRVAVMDGFKDQSILREIFRQYTKTYEDRTKTAAKNAPKENFGIRELTNKDIFFQPSQLISAAWNYGKNLADSENLFLFDRIQSECNRSSLRGFEQALKKAGAPEDVFILGTVFTLENFFGAAENFRPADRTSLEIDVKRNPVTAEIKSIPGYAGSYYLGEHAFPVFVFQHRGSANQFLILNRSRLGKMMQFPVAPDGVQHKRTGLLENIFHFDVRSLSKDRKLLKKYTEAKDAEWLRQQGDKPAQKEYLLKRALVIFQQNPGFQKAKNFVGFKILVKRTEAIEDSLSGFSV